MNISNMYELEQSDIIVLDIKLWDMELADLIEVNDYGGRCLTRMIRGSNLTIED